MNTTSFCRRLALLVGCGLVAIGSPAQSLPGTRPLEMTGDIASNLVAGADRFLQRQTELAVRNRSHFWHLDFANHAAYEASLATNRQRLAEILGIRDPRVSPVALQVTAAPGDTDLVGRGAGFEAFAVSWPAFGDVRAEGLLLRPAGRAPVAGVVAIPDAGQTPEQLAGLAPGIAPESQFARRLAESGCQVVIPCVISRGNDRVPALSNREFLYRPAYELGRQLIGYEIQKVLAAADWLAAANGPGALPVGVMGWGEGGLLAAYSAALEPRLRAACVSGFFGSREDLWRQPVDRNVFGLLERFGDAEIAALIAPRGLVIEAARGPEFILPQRNGAPGRLVSPPLGEVRAEFARARALVAGLAPPAPFSLVESGAGAGPYGSEPTLTALLQLLAPTSALAPSGPTPTPIGPPAAPAERAARQLHELDRHSQNLLIESPFTRQKYFAQLDTKTPEKFGVTLAPYRERFYRDVIGRFPDPLLPPNVQSRRLYDRTNWTGHEVVMDVFPDLIAYGILLVPKDLRPGERRPVVVCQHGLEGRAQDVVTGDLAAYHDFAARLCDRGFITFAPQNLYLFTDRFRALQRRANPLGKTLYSLIVPQHQQITDWLKRLPFVDPARIGFYGLSYGGKTAMRVPPLVTNYCLSICSADFNDWVWKNASTRSPYSYTWNIEYEIFEWDLGSTFNYAEMAALIAPRPFMVERGHFDGVAPDETVAYEFAKVRYLYEARLGLRDQCAIELFTGPHTINGRGTFDFLHRHLNWPGPGPP